MKNRDYILNMARCKHVKLENENGKCIAALVDNAGYEIVKGYGGTIIEAINDMHAGLV